MADKTIFEHPLNEKCRTWLRLSHLFEQFDFHASADDEWNARAAMSALLDVANVLARADIKSELLKDLDRYRQSLSRMADTPGVDTERLDQILDNLYLTCRNVRDVNGQLGQALRANDFLTSIVQRSSIAGGTFDFDLPQYHYWLRMPAESREEQLVEWRDEVRPVQQGADLLLSLIRSSSVPAEQQANNGFYQKTLPSSMSAHLIRIGVSADGGVYPEVSGGKQRFSIRFLDCGDWQSPFQVEHSVPFSLSICAI